MPFLWLAAAVVFVITTGRPFLVNTIWADESQHSESMLKNPDVEICRRSQAAPVGVGICFEIGRP